MNYTSPKGPLEVDQKKLVPGTAIPIMDGEKNVTIELMKQLTDVTAYGMLLLDDPKHPMAELVRERWSEINNLTGDHFMVFAFERPAEWTKNYLQYWQAKLGPDFKTTWKKWQDPPDPGAAYGYLSLFKPPLTPKQLPCLVLFTDPLKREVVVRPIPDWDKDSLFDLLKGIATVVQQSADTPQAERLEWLGGELTSPGARFQSAAGHIAALALDYFKAHPAVVASTAISLALALSGAGVFALPTAAVPVLKVLKDTLSGGAKSGAK